MGRSVSENTKKYILFFLLSVFIIFSIFFRDGASFIIELFLVTLAVILVASPEEEMRFLAVVFIVSFLARVALMSFLHHQSYIAGSEGFLSGDERLYTLKAVKISSVWQNMSYNTECDIGREFYGVNPFTYILALFYTLFNPNYFASKLINCYIGALAPLVIFFAAKKAVSANVAKIALVLMAFYPSFIRWSLGNMKDPLTILIASTIVFLAVSFRTKTHIAAKALGLIVLIYLLKDLQITLFIACVVTVLSFCIYSLLRRVKQRNVLIGIIVSLIILGAVIYQSARPMLIHGIASMINKSLALCISDNAGYFIYDVNTVHQIRNGILNIPGLVSAYFKGAAYFLFSPFPWCITSVNQLFAYPQIILWYFLLFFSVIGLSDRLKTNRQESIFALLFLIMIISFSAMGEANMGSAFRHRDTFSPVIFIYASIGMTVLFRGKR